MLAGSLIAMAISSTNVLPLDARLPAVFFKLIVLGLLLREAGGEWKKYEMDFVLNS